MFDINIVNTFSTSTVRTLKSYNDGSVSKGNVIVKNSFSPLMGVGVLIAFAGDLDGRALFDMDKPTAFNLASMLNGERIEAVDDIFIATVKEFTNMVVGGAVNELSTRNIDVTITTPTLLMGEHMSLVEKAAEQILVINYDTDIGIIALNLVFSGRP
ncbi:MAG: chemotaxis protein CheX [Spirochaetes bacterium]|nr:chemotaxis protein CheX [Spirochaetota bacterium]